MAIVNFLALLWGFSLVIGSFAFLIKPKHLESVLAITENKTTLVLLSMFSLVLGIASVLSYNVWSQDWNVVITILGWLLIIKGMAYLFVPEMALAWIAKWKQHATDWLPMISVGGVVVGCALIYLGAV